VSKHYLDSQVSPADVTVLGIGNLLMGDEGVGIHLIRTLEESYTFSPSINLIDGGTTGLDLIPYFEDCKKMIIIDAVDSQKEPGYIETLFNEEIHFRFNTKLSLHHAGLADVLSVIKLTDIPSPDMMLIGIQPKIVEMGIELSDVISDKMEMTLSIVIEKLKEWKIECKPIPT
jgi:hydrogenase maturation protease